MSKDREAEAATAMWDFIVMPLLIFVGLFIIASICEAILNLNIESFKLTFLAITSIPIFILYLKEKLTS